MAETMLDYAKRVWEGEGNYAIGWSDGGMDWTDDGPAWFDTVQELADELEAAQRWATETHLPWAERV